MSELTEVHRVPGQLALVDADDPQWGGWAPHSRHCGDLGRPSQRWPGEVAHHCVDSCPRRAQVDKYVIGTMVVPVELLDVSLPTEVLDGPE